MLRSARGPSRSRPVYGRSSSRRRRRITIRPILGQGELFLAMPSALQRLPHALVRVRPVGQGLTTPAFYAESVLLYRRRSLRSIAVVVSAAGTSQSRSPIFRSSSDNVRGGSPSWIYGSGNSPQLELDGRLARMTSRRLLDRCWLTTVDLNRRGETVTPVESGLSVGKVVGICAMGNGGHRRSSQRTRPGSGPVVDNRRAKTNARGRVQ